MKNRWKKAVTASCAFVLGATVICTSACGSETGSVTETLFGSRDTLAINQDADDPDEDEDDTAEETVTAVITLSDGGSTVTGGGAGDAEDADDGTGSSSVAGVTINGDRIEITAEGTYEISGTLSDGQIYVEASDDDTVTLILDGVDITNKTEPAIYAESAKKLRIHLEKGSENFIQSGTSMPDEVDENASGGAIYSRDDLVIKGSGSLTVNGYIKDGIHGNDDVKIKNGTIEVNAAHHAVKANETLTVSGGDLNLTSAEDGLHSSGDLLITGGEIVISAGDDGMHADTDLTIEDGMIGISRSYEGIEANRIYVKGGEIAIASRDDGFNAYGGTHNMGFGTATITAEDPELIIDDGTIYVNAGGDGLDSNGDLIVNGGYIIVDGPESSANGALDSGMENGGVCLVNGGTVLAIGASGMAERFGNNSTQGTFRLNVGTHEAGTDITITDSDGNEIFSYTSAKSFASIVFSSPDIEVGSDYTVTVGSDSYSFTQDSISYYNSAGSMSGTGGTPGNIPGGTHGGPGH